MTATPSPQARLIVALDVPSIAEAEALVERIGDAAEFYKIGLELAFGGGIELARRLAHGGRKVFLDLKLHDIPATVSRATAQVANLGAAFLTIHGYPQTMRAALEGLGGSPLKLLAVTAMTSYDDDDLREAGYAYGARELVARRAAQARDAGVHGLVLSAGEAAETRRLVGPDMILATPGIRHAGDARSDQKRVMGPREAILAGADYLVVGRPITRAADPGAAARAFVAEIAAAVI